MVIKKQWLMVYTTQYSKNEYNKNNTFMTIDVTYM